MLKERIREAADLLATEAAHFYDLIANIPGVRLPVTDEKNVGEKRAERVCWKFPVYLGSARGMTRDISASGVFFETDATFPLSSSVPFEVELDAPNGKFLLKYFGEVVRIEPRGKRVGVAVRIIKSSVEPICLA